VGQRLRDFDGGLPDFRLELTPENVRAIYEVTSSVAPEEARYVYAVEGLRASDDKTIDLPCKTDAKSRWRKVACSNAAASVNAQVHEIFQTILSSTHDENPFVRDIWKSAVAGECPAPVFGLTDFEVEDDIGNCWLNVHPDHWNVYDFTIWTQNHPGNLPPRNPIKEFAESGFTALEFPDWHDMNRWQGNKGRFGLVGRLYDLVHYYDIPGQLRTIELSEYFGFSSTTISFSNSTGVLVCGSPDELSNDLFLGGNPGLGSFDSFIFEFSTTPDNDFIRQKRTIWTEISVGASDQVRQRVAWALAQILVVSPDASRNSNLLTETHLAYYDILVSSFDWTSFSICW